MNSILEDLRNSFRRTGNGLNQIVVINVVLFVVLIISKVLLTITGLREWYESASHLLFLPASTETLLYQPWSLLTYFFVHEDFFHILFNMMFLYWFGMLISEFIGNKRLISIYVLGGIVAGLLYITLYNTIPYFQGRSEITYLLGASGGVYAVVFAAATLLPDYTFFLLFLGPVRIKYIAAFYFLLSFAETIGSNAGGSIAHIGGALFGMAFIWQLRRGNDLGKPVEWVLSLSSLRKRQASKIKVSYKNQINSSKTSSSGDVSQEEIDLILDKISQYGYEKLTKDEKQKLFKASQSTHI